MLKSSEFHNPPLGNFFFIKLQHQSFEDWLPRWNIMLVFRLRTLNLLLFSITASLDCISHSSAVVTLQYLSLESRSAPNNVASWFRLWSLWAGRWGAWLFPASRSLLTCSCCRPWRRCWTWSTTLRCLRSSSSLASCSFLAAFFWILSSCGRRVNVTVKPCRRTSLASKSWPFF